MHSPHCNIRVISVAQVRASVSISCLESNTWHSLCHIPTSIRQAEQTIEPFVIINIVSLFYAKGGWPLPISVALQLLFRSPGSSIFHLYSLSPRIKYSVSQCYPSALETWISSPTHALQYELPSNCRKFIVCDVSCRLRTRLRFYYSEYNRTRFASTSVPIRVTLRTCSCRRVNHIENEL